MQDIFFLNVRIATSLSGFKLIHAYDPTIFSLITESSSKLFNHF